MTEAATWIPYCGAAPAPGELLARWNFDPALLALLALMLFAALKSPRTDRRLLFAVIALFAVLFLSPFCALTSALFSARAVHHLALTAIAAPLLAIALPERRVPGGVAPWTVLHAVIFWAWHAPSAYEAALSSHAVYWLMQGSLFLTALALWRAMRAAAMVSGLAALLATMVQMGLLGALLTFAGRPLYAPHFLAPQAWGLSALEDQQLAGLIMWAPGAGLYLAAALILAARWFAHEQRSAAITR
ncbi:MAG TPA: cytochrome c oxidase assembly protein [Sphingomonas sp.]|nr:cytochrome c oxidase assembly protein [Sphingomonas sp.]